MTYKLLENKPLPQLESEIAKFWEKNNIFQRSVDETNGGEFVFYDGPPFANGLPHYGHLLTSFIKDIYARYQTMQGLKTERRFGWDCHGLPAEMEVEKQLGIQGRVDITNYGIGKFNDACEKSVMKYASDWEDYITKAGRWVDFENDYKTMDISYMESVIWAFKNLYDKGLVYEDYRVMPYSWKAETPLSNFETRMDNAYREKSSKAVTVKFELTSGKHAGKKLLVWTTTPWTLPSNLMIAVHKEVDYVTLTNGEERLIIAKNLISKYSKDFVNYYEDLSNSEISFAIFSGNDERFQNCNVIRNEVFVIGQNVPQERERDGLDLNSIHVLCYYQNKPAGTTRLRIIDNYIKIERVAVLNEFQGRGLAKIMMWQILSYIKTLPNIKTIKLSSQKYIESFYSKFGFKAKGDIYIDANIEHIDMELDFKSINLQNFAIKGEELVGSSYKPLFPYFKNHANSFKILHGDFVTTEDGTGAVHIAPGFGEDDWDLCKKNGISIVCPVDEKGNFTAEIFDIDEKKQEKVLPKTKIELQNLYVEEITHSHFDLVKKLYQDKEVRHFYDKQFLIDEEVKAEIDLYIKLREKFGEARYAIFEKTTKEFVGVAGIDNVTLNSSEKQYGLTLHKKFWGKGYGTEIGKALLEFCGVNEISAYVKDENIASVKMLEKLGFKNRGKKIYERTGAERTHYVFETGVLSLKNRQVFETNDDIIKYLKKQGSWLKTEQYLHNYPHCWRTDTPLIYKAVPSWYVEVTKFRDKMVEVNKEINWIPGHIKDGLFGKWIENARDWSISRNRFWGCPVPVWKWHKKALTTPHGTMMQHVQKQYDEWQRKKNETKVFGSISEMEDFFKDSYINGDNSGYYIQEDGSFKITNLHRPFIDELKIDDGYFELKRVEDVLDCWFESGSMPFASVHYPFALTGKNGEVIRNAQENKKWFEEHFPADFIVEYSAQTRGWFYTLVVLGTALFGKAPFKNCICHGVILDENGNKLSKRLRNYPDPMEVFGTIGSDAMRYFVVSSPVVMGGELYIPRTSQGIQEIVRLVIKPIWNAYTFFAMYANADKITAEKSYASANEFDIYIFSQLHEFVRDFQKSMNEYNTQTACKLVTDFIDILNNWYIRRNKERFWKHEHDEDKISAYNTLYTVIVDFVATIAPILPFTSEAIFQFINDNNK